MKGFNLSEKVHHNYKSYDILKLMDTPGIIGIVKVEDVKEFIRLLKEEINNAKMHADMEEDEFWRTSKISPQQAGFRAKYLEEFGIKIDKLSGNLQ